MVRLLGLQGRLQHNNPTERQVPIVLSVIGTRPEAIKMKPVVKKLGKHSSRIRSVLCSTGRYRERFVYWFNLVKNRAAQNFHLRIYVILAALFA